MQYSSSLACLTPELAELLLTHMARERLLRPRTLELFFGCPLQKFVLNCYPYTTNEMLRQLRAFSCLKHLSLVNSPLITGVCVCFVLFRLEGNRGSRKICQILISVLKKLFIYYFHFITIEKLGSKMQ